MKHYRANFVEVDCPSGISTAAIRSCLCCGEILCGMGGGSEYICAICLFKIRDGSHLDPQYKLAKILRWIEAYPLDVFPEPDFKKAAKVLKENGMTLDAISASNMRHVLNGIKAIIES